jgi:hypothetical protein
MSKSKKALADGPAADSIDAFIARNAADGDRLADKVAAKLLQFENAPFFVPMLKSLMKQATASLDSESVKEVAATVQVRRCRRTRCAPRAAGWLAPCHAPRPAVLRFAARS